MFGILDHYVEGIERFLTRESPDLRTRNIRLGARDGRTDRCQESRLIDASHFYFHRTGRLTALLPTHFDLAMRVAFKDRRATHGVNGNPSTPGDKADDLDRKSTRLNSSHSSISYAVFCLKKKKTTYREFRYIKTKRKRIMSTIDMYKT